MKENVNKDTPNQNKTSEPVQQQSQDNIDRKDRDSQMGSGQPQQGDPSLNN